MLGDRIMDTRLEDFLEKYPEYRGERIELTDNGTAYIHGNCAYPLIIKNAVKPITDD